MDMKTPKGVAVELLGHLRLEHFENMNEAEALASLQSDPDTFIDEVEGATYDNLDEVMEIASRLIMQLK